MQVKIPDSADVCMLGGNCPVQGEGTIHGLPFYFRSRGRGWTFDVGVYPEPEGDAVGGDSVLSLSGDYSDDEYMAGWLAPEESAAMLCECLVFADRMIPARCAEAVCTGMRATVGEPRVCAACGLRYGEHGHKWPPKGTDWGALPQCMGMRASFVKTDET